MAIMQNAQDGGVGDQDLRRLQEMLAAPFPKQGFWTTPVARELRHREFLANKEMAVEAFLLPYKIRESEAIASGREAEARNLGLTLKARRAELGSLAGMGMPPGVDTEALSRISENIGRSNLLKQQAHAQAVATKLQTQTIDEMMDDLLGKQAVSMGVKADDLKTAMQVNQAAQNSQAAQRAQLEDSFMMGFDQIEQAYRQQAGNPKLDLFGLKDAKAAAEEMQQLLAGNPTLTPEDAFRQVYGKAAGLARNKFLEVSGMGNDLRGGGAMLPQGQAQSGPEGLLEMMRRGATSPRPQPPQAGVRFMLEGLLGMDQTPPELGVGLDRTTTSLNRSLEGLK